MLLHRYTFSLAQKLRAKITETARFAVARLNQCDQTSVHLEVTSRPLIMQLALLGRATKRPRVILLFLVTSTILWLLGKRHHQSPPPHLPLPGTYQYFHEIDLHSKTKQFGAVSHCDARFAPASELPIEDVRHALRLLVKSYMAIMTELEVKSWLAHGSLLGWYWNKRILPWDTDIDVQVSPDGLAVLARHNMSEYP